MPLTFSRERNLLRIAVALGGLVPVCAGLAGVFGGSEVFDRSGGSSSESHFRYLSGLLLGIGLAYWASIPMIERHRERFRLLTAIVFLGGLARLYTVATLGSPNLASSLALTMELAVVPLICLWQNSLAARSS